MPENTCCKYSLSELFDKVNLSSVRLPGMPDSIYRFFGHREHVNIIFWRNNGYDVYTATKEFDAITISTILGDVSRVIAGVHIPIARHMSYTSTHNS